MPLVARCQTLRPDRESGWLVFFELVTAPGRQGHFFVVGPGGEASADSIRISLTAGQAAVRYFKDSPGNTSAETLLTGAADLFQDYAEGAGTQLEYGCGVLQGDNLWFLTHGQVRLLSTYRTAAEPLTATRVTSISPFSEDRVFFGYLPEDRDPGEILAENFGREGGLMLSFQGSAQTVSDVPNPIVENHPGKKAIPPAAVIQPKASAPPFPSEEEKKGVQPAERPKKVPPQKELRVSQSLAPVEEARGLLFWLGLVVSGVALLLIAMYLFVWRQPVQEMVADKVSRDQRETAVRALLSARGAWSIEKLWESRFKSPVTSTARLGGTGLIFGCRDGTVNCFNLDNGARQWAYAASRGFGSSPAIGGNTVVIGGYDGLIYGLVAATGGERWVRETGGRIVSSPTIHENTAYVGSYDKSLYAVDVASGRLLWRTGLGSILWASPAVEGDLVLAAGLDGRVHALEARSGSIRWSMATGGAIYSSLLVAERKAFVGSEDGYIYALELETGEVIWKIQAPAKVHGSPGYHEGRIVIGAEDGTVLAIDVGLGAVVWSAQTRGPVRSRPAFGEGLVWVTSYDGSLWGFQLGSGETEVEYPLSSSIYASPLLHDHRLYVGSMDGTFSALELRRSP